MGGLMDEHEIGPLTDVLDRAGRATEIAMEAALEEQAERAKPRFRAYQIEGVYHCPECLEPLPAHRIEPGICVPCLSAIEEQEKRTWRR